jgi:hypothetical protein
MYFKCSSRIIFHYLFFVTLFFGFGNHSSLFAYDIVSIDHGGILKGMISLKGTPPANIFHDVEKDSNVCGSKVQEETYEVNAENHGLQNVVISIEGISEGKAPLSTIALIENKKCHFFPHIQVGITGQFFEVINSDPIMHNTHLKMENFTLLNVIMPAHGKNIKKNIRDPGLIKIQCDAHKFMHGWFVVNENPYFAVTDHEGNYKISDIPPGKYKIRIWHEGLSVKERNVTINSGKKTDLSLELEL